MARTQGGLEIRVRSFNDGFLKTAGPSLPLLGLAGAQREPTIKPMTTNNMLKRRFFTSKNLPIPDIHNKLSTKTPNCYKACLATSQLLQP